jgi:hypothetical protein
MLFKKMQHTIDHMQIQGSINLLLYVLVIYLLLTPKILGVFFIKTASKQPLLKAT